MSNYKAATAILLAIAFCTDAIAQQPPTPAAAPVAKMSAKEKAAEKQRLFAEKKVATWPTRGVRPPGGAVAVPLTAQECNALGGKIEYWEDCETTNTKCVVNGHEVCIDEHPKKK